LGSRKERSPERGTSRHGEKVKKGKNGYQSLVPVTTFGAKKRKRKRGKNGNKQRRGITGTWVSVVGGKGKEAYIVLRNDGSKKHVRKKGKRRRQAPGLRLAAENTEKDKTGKKGLTLRVRQWEEERKHS